MEQPTFQPAQTTSTMAIVSLILGILGLVGVLPIIGSIGAIITGNMAQKEIAASPGRYSGEGMARGGTILGWVGVGLGALACCAGVLFFGLPFVIAIIGEATSSFLPSLPYLF